MNHSLLAHPLQTGFGVLRGLASLGGREKRRRNILGRGRRLQQVVG